MQQTAAPVLPPALIQAALEEKSGHSSVQ